MIAVADTNSMRRWIIVGAVTVFAVTLVGAVATGVDWVWRTAPASFPVAAVLGDPRVHVEVEMPQTPHRVPIYGVSRPISAAQLRRVLPGDVSERDGWLFWRGDSTMDPVSVMNELNPGVPWQALRGHIGPAPFEPAYGVSTGGLSSAFTGTDVPSNSFGTYATDGRTLVSLSIPAHRIERVGSMKVLPAVVALLDMRHHKSTARLLPNTVPLLPKRMLTSAEVTTLPAVTAVRLVQAQDPQDPTRSKPIWVFDPVGEVDAER